MVNLYAEMSFLDNRWFQWNWQRNRNRSS